MFACGGELIEDLARRIFPTCHREENFVVGIIERCEGGEILLEPGLDALDRTDQGDARLVETAMAPNPALRHVKPAQPIPEVMQSLQDLFNDQEIEQCKHGWHALLLRGRRGTSVKSSIAARAISKFKLCV